MPVDAAPQPIERLNPVFEVGGQDVVLMTHFLSAVPTSTLSSHVTNLENRRDRIVDAIDFLQQGF